MSSVNFLEMLLDGQEVKLKALGEIGVFVRGSGIQKSDFTESGVGCIHYGQIHTHYGTWTTETKSFLSREFSARLRKARTGDLVIATTSEDDEAVAKAVAWLGSEEVAVSTDAYIFRHKANPKYASYFFQTEHFQSQKRPHITGTKVRRISGESLSKIEIPIPCPEDPQKSLEIQAEIVRILDAMTAHAAELTAELTARKKQYNYYRDKLLIFEDGEIEWKKLGEVADFRRGTAITQKQTTVGDIPVVANGPVPTYFHGESNRDGETIVVARSGAYAGYVSFWKQPLFLTDAFSIHPDLKFLRPKFLYHVLQNKQEHIHSMKKGAGVPHVRVKEFQEYEVPIPSLSEQSRIVSILDKFDALTTSITEGLPREIELRKKQYAYYRDLLLSFPQAQTS